MIHLSLWKQAPFSGGSILQHLSQPQDRDSRQDAFIICKLKKINHDFNHAENITVTSREGDPCLKLHSARLWSLFWLPDCFFSLGLFGIWSRGLRSLNWVHQEQYHCCQSSREYAVSLQRRDFQVDPQDRCTLFLNPVETWGCGGPFLPWSSQIEALPLTLNLLLHQVVGQNPTEEEALWLLGGRGTCGSSIL